MPNLSAVQPASNLSVLQSGGFDRGRRSTALLRPMYCCCCPPLRYGSLPGCAVPNGFGAIKPAAKMSASASGTLPGAEVKGRLLIKGATVLSMDPAIGSLARGDVLIEGGIILAVAPSIDAEANVFDAAGLIVLPGFVDTHRHTWQSVLRGFAPNAVVTGYGRDINTVGQVYRPEDVYAGTLLSCLNAINSGVTSLLSWSHISNSPEHTDADVEALAASGIRGIFGYGQSRAGIGTSRYPDDIYRIKKRYFSSKDQLLTLALGANVDRCSYWPMARELDVRITAHIWPQWVMPLNDSRLSSSGDSSVAQLEAAYAKGLMGPDVTYIHCTQLDAESWKKIEGSGGTVSLSAPSIGQFGVGAGVAPIQQALDSGIRPSLSVDTEVALPSDFFHLMRTTFTLQRALAHESSLIGGLPVSPITVRDVLEFATVEGARANGMLDRVGTLTPGKQADLIAIRADGLGTMPMNNAYATVVLNAEKADVDLVVIAGKVVKSGGRLVGIDMSDLTRMVTRSRDWLATAAGQPTDAIGDGYGLP